MNNTDPSINDKLLTYSIKGFIKYVKCKFVQNYEVNCNIRNCYICRNDNV